MTETQSPSNSVHVRLKHSHGIVFDISSGRKVVLPGSDFHLVGLEKGVLECGFSKTTVPSNDWDEVLAMYGKMPQFRNGTLVYANDSASADDKAADYKDTRHGLEPVDVENDKTIKTTEVSSREA